MYYKSSGPVQIELDDMSQEPRADSVQIQVDEWYNKIFLTDYVKRLFVVILVWFGIIAFVGFFVALGCLFYFGHNGYAPSQVGIVVGTNPYMIQFCNGNGTSNTDWFELYYGDDSSLLGNEYGLYQLYEIAVPKTELGIGDTVKVYWSNQSYQVHKVFGDCWTDYTESYGLYLSSIYVHASMKYLMVFCALAFGIVIMIIPFAVLEDGLRWVRRNF